MGEGVGAGGGAVVAGIVVAIVLAAVEVVVVDSGSTKGIPIGIGSCVRLNRHRSPFPVPRIPRIPRQFSFDLGQPEGRGVGLGEGGGVEGVGTDRAATTQLVDG